MQLWGAKKADSHGVFYPWAPSFIRFCCCLPPTSSLWGHILLLPQTFILQPSEQCGLFLSLIPQVNNVFSFADGGLSSGGTSWKSIPGQRTPWRQIHLETHEELWGRLGLTDCHCSLAPGPGAVQLGPQEAGLEQGPALLSDPQPPWNSEPGLKFGSYLFPYLQEHKLRPCRDFCLIPSCSPVPGTMLSQKCTTNIC